MSVRHALARWLAPDLVARVYRAGRRKEAAFWKAHIAEHFVHKATLPASTPPIVTFAAPPSEPDDLAPYEPLIQARWGDMPAAAALTKTYVRRLKRERPNLSAEEIARACEGIEIEIE